MESFLVDQQHPDTAYMWLETHLSRHKEHYRVLPQDCDCFLIQVGPSDLTEEEAIDFYQTLDGDAKKHGFLEQDWKGFDSEVLEFVNPWLKHVHIEYSVGEDDLVVEMKLVPKKSDADEHQDAFDRFEELKRDIFEDRLSKQFGARDISFILASYVVNIFHDIQWKDIAREIKDAKKISKTFRVHDYEPGTGKGTTQFFRVLNTLYNDGKPIDIHMKRESWLLLIRCYVMDQLE